MAFIDLDDHVIAQVRDASDIVEVVTQITPLKVAGKSHKGLCPFHREKTPSFHVDRDKGLFYCFGCGEGGDVFKFLMLTERYTFPEAVEHLAGRAGITLPRRTSTREKEHGRDELLRLVEDAAHAFHEALKWTPNPADQYLNERGIAAEIRQKYGLGYAPDSWDYILQRLGRKYSTERMEEAGLILPRKKGTGHYDRFRNRLIVPIHSENGSIIGFGGRSLDGSEPKYLNSPESPIFNKSNLLYNLHRTRQHIRKRERAILVEGYFDCIALDHAGIQGVVASMGTSLTSGQASILRRLANRVVVFYDGDDAGRAATLRAAPVLLGSGLAVDVVAIGQNEDPDSYLKKHGTDRVVETIGQAVDVFEFAIGETVTDVDQMSGTERRDSLEALLPLLTSVADPVLRVDAAQRIADRLRLPFETIGSKLPSSRRGAERDVPPSRSGPIATGEKRLLREILAGTAPVELVERVEAAWFEDPSCRRIFEIASAREDSTQPLDFSTIATHLKSEADLNRLSELAFDDESSRAEPRILEQTVRFMQRRRYETRMRDLQARIQEAMSDGDSDRIETLMAEKLQLSRLLVALK